MRAVVQRVSQASVEVDGASVGAIDRGLLVLIGITHDDDDDRAAWLARKVWSLRIFDGERSAADLEAPILAISQFTLYGDARKGRRPTWTAAAPGPVAEPLYEVFCEHLKALGATVERGVFGADMQVHLSIDGPITILLEREA